MLLVGILEDQIGNEIISEFKERPIKLCKAKQAGGRIEKKKKNRTKHSRTKIQKGLTYI